MINRDMVLVQDEIEADTIPDIYWFMHFNSSALVISDTHQGIGCSLTSIPTGNPVTISIGRTSLWLNADFPGAQFLLMKALPLPNSPHPSGDVDNSNYCKLAINLHQGKSVTLPVYLVPLKQGQQPPTLPAVTPLSNW